MRLLISLILTPILSLSTGLAANAPGAPGLTPHWSSAKKVQVGTSYTWDGEHKSLVWFSAARGILTETYYPTIDEAQIKDAQILATDGQEYFVEEKNDLEHSVEWVSASKVLLKNKDKQNAFSLKHHFYTLNNKSVLVDEVTLKVNKDGLHFYLLVNPHLKNSGHGDSGEAKNQSLLFTEGERKLKVYTTQGFEKTSMGYVGVNDGWTQLNRDKKLGQIYTQAKNGNVAGIGKIKLPTQKGTYRFYIVYDFENGSKLSKAQLKKAALEYHQKWKRALDQLYYPKMDLKEEKLYSRSLYMLKTHEDKLNPGAYIASLSVPWGEELYEEPGNFAGGYHLIWPRDLYHVCLALIEAGDYSGAERALNFLRKIQYKEGVWNYPGRRIPKKGAFPQNTWTTGKEYWGGLQLDQVGYPVHLFYHLYKKLDRGGKDRLMREYSEMVHKALRFIQQYGPWTGQERWEENFGISPSSFAVATSALLIGEELFPGNLYATTAKAWLTKPGDNIHTWTFTTSGIYGDGNYYLRVGGCSSYLAPWNPNLDEVCTVANSWQKLLGKALLDQGFLKLGLLGLMPVTDWRIRTSLEKVNQHLRVTTPRGTAWYRYSYDAYGEEDKGRLWTLLISEHGRHQIELHRSGVLSESSLEDSLSQNVQSYLGFANAGGALPEQVFEESGEGTGGATPLAWSHAEYIKLLWSRHLGKNVENPGIEK